MENKIKQNKNIFIVVIILAIVAIISVGTYALVVWGSEEDTSVSVRVGDTFGVYFEEGPNINVSDMGPVLDYEKDGESTHFIVTNTTTETASINGYLKVTGISDELKREDFKYAVMSTTDNIKEEENPQYELVSEGDFSKVQTDDSIPLFKNENVTTASPVTYKVILYIDGNVENPISMQEKELTGYIYAETGDLGIYYDANGGKGAPEFQVKTAQTMELSANAPTREAFTFIGWNTEKDGSGSYYQPSMNEDETLEEYQKKYPNNYPTSITVDKAVTLYAQWRGTTYNINYYIGNGSTTAGTTLLGTSTCEYKGDCTLNSFSSSFPSSSAGWSFAGWGTTQTGLDISYKDAEKFTYLTEGNINLYAIGERTINFNSGIAPTKAVNTAKQYWNPYQNTSNYLSTVKLTKEANIEGWKFLGYAHVNTASSSITYDANKINTEVAIAYNSNNNVRAVYERNLTIKYAANGGLGSIADTTIKQYYNSGIGNNGTNSGANVSVSTSQITLPSTGLTKAGYTLIGWSDDEKNNNYNIGDRYTGFNPAVRDKDVENTLKAIWAKNEFVINYYLGDGTENPNSTKIGSTKCTYGQTCTLSSFANLNAVFPSNTKGWSFYGWTTTEGGLERMYNDGATFTHSVTELNKDNLVMDDVNLYAIGQRQVSFYSGNTPSTALKTETQYWNPYANSSDYLTDMTLPTQTALSSWNFTGYLFGSNVASSNVTYDATKVGTQIKPKYNIEPIARSVYNRTITLKYDVTPGSGTIPDMVVEQYYNSGYASNNTNIGANITTPSFILPSTGVTPVEGYTWEGWKDGDKVYGRGAVYTDFVPDVGNTTVTKTLNAKYDVIIYDVNLYVGKTLARTIQCIHGVSCTLPAFSELGMAFPSASYGWGINGWNYNTDGTSATVANGGSIITRSDDDLYAVGVRTFKFYSGINAGSVNTTQKQYWNPYENTHLTSITIPAATTLTCNSWSFKNYKLNDTSASANNLLTTWTIGASITPAYNSSYEVMAVYERDITLTYNGNGNTGGTAPANTSSKQYYNSGRGTGTISGVSITLASNTNKFTKTGYTFSKWAAGSTSGTQYAEGYAYTEFAPAVDDCVTSKTMYAIWTANGYTITYHLGNGTTTEGATAYTTTTNCTFDSNCTLETFSSLGKTFPLNSYLWSFAGWSTANNTTTRNYTDGQTFKYQIAGNLDLYAVGKRYVYFNDGYNATSYDTGEAPIQYWNPYKNATSHLTSVTVPAADDLSDYGWTFIGYNHEVCDNTNKCSITNTVSYDASKVNTKVTPLANNSARVMGKYQRTVTLTYNGNGSNGGSAPTNSTATQYYNTGWAGDSQNNFGANISTPSYTLPTNTFTRTGYTFKKWAAGSTSGTQYEQGATYTGFKPEVLETASQTMYAIWSINSYTVTLTKGTGISGVTGAGTYEYGESVTIDATVKTGYTWKEWTGDKPSTTKSYTFTMPANDVNNTAHATANTYTIGYTLNGGTKGTNGPTSGTFDSLVTIDNPKKTVTVTGNVNGTSAEVGTATSKAQTFAGWKSSSSDGLGLNAVTGTTTSPSTSWTGTATKNKYFKNLRDTSGTVTLTATWTPQAVTLPTLSKTGYTCNWYDAATGGNLMGAGGASWTPSATSPAAVTAYARCTINKYTVTLNKGTGISAVSGAGEYDYGASVTIDATVSTGYTWKEWTGTKPSTTKTYTFTMPANDVTNTATTTENTYNITVVPNGGSCTANKTGVKFTATNQFTCTGKTITVTGDANGTGATVGSATSKAQIFANWTGSGLESSAQSGASSSSLSAWTGTATTNTYFKSLRNTSGTATLTANWTPQGITLPTLSKTGYTCAWYDAQTGGNKLGNSGATWTPSSTTPASVTAYAQCTINSYTVTLNKGTGISAVTGAGTYTYGQEVTIEATVETGYTWKEWTGTKSSTSNPYTFTMPANDVTNTATTTANTYTIGYTMNGGTKGTNAPTSGTYNSLVTIDNPTKSVTVTGNANNTGATITGSPTTAISQEFLGWTSSTTSAGLGANAVTGTTTSPSTAWNGSTATKNKYFKNLRDTSGTVTLTATWNPKSITLPKVTKDGYTCGWNESSTGTTITYKSEGSWTPGATQAASKTMYAVCKANTATVTIKKNGSNWSSSGINVALYSGTTSKYAYSAGTASGATVTWSGVAAGTYNIYAGKSSNGKTTLIDTGVDITVSTGTTSAGSGSATINYYGLTLAKGTGISAVSNGGTSTTSEVQYLYNSSSPQTIAIDATVSTGYTWSTWTKTSGTNLKTFTPATKSQNIQMGAGATTLTASANINNYTLTVKSGTGGSVKVEDTTKSTSVTAASGETKTLSVTHGDTIKVTATAGSGYTLSTLKHGSTSMSSGGTFTASGTETVEATWAANTAKITINKNGSAWSASGIKVTLYNGTTATSYTTTVSSGSVASLSAVPNGTYNIYAGKNSGAKTTLVDTGVDVTVNNNSPTATINYYTLTLNTGTGISEVNGWGTYLSNQTASIGATPSTGYKFSSWTVNSGNTPASTTTASTTVSMSKATTLTANGVLKTYTITVKSGTGGSVKLENTTASTSVTATTGTTKTLSVTHGDSLKVTTTATNCYNLNTLKRGTTSISSGTTFTASGAETIEATWTVKTFTFTLGSATGATTTGSTATGTYNCGSTITLKASANTGYTWSKWTSNNTSLVSDKTTANTTFTMPAGNIKMTPTVTANTNTAYTVKHWQQNVDAADTENSTNYTVKDTQNLTGTTGASVTPAVKSYTGFTAPSTKTVTILGDGSRVVNYYYKRNHYTITGKTSTGITSVTGGGTYDYGKTVTLTAIVEPGYDFSHWQKGSTVVSTNGETYSITVTANATYTAYASGRAVSYKVYHWKQNIDAADTENSTNYTLVTADTQSLTGTAGTSVTPAVKSYTGFTAPSTQTITILGNGTSEVNYYYKRNSYTLTVSKGTGIASVTGGGTYDYGKSVTINATLSTGYEWSGWSTNVINCGANQQCTFNMPAKTFTMTASGTGIEYNVTLNPDGGTTDMASIATTTTWTTNNSLKTLDSKIKLMQKGLSYGSAHELPTPTWAGHTFTGWSTVSQPKTFTLQTWDDDYWYYRLLNNVVPGLTYKVRIESSTNNPNASTLNTNAPTSFQVVIHDHVDGFDDYEPLASVTKSFSSSAIEFEITCPSSANVANPLKLDILAGLKGSTANTEVKFTNVTVTVTGNNTSPSMYEKPSSGNVSFTFPSAGQQVLFAHWDDISMLDYLENYNVSGLVKPGSDLWTTYSFDSLYDSTGAANNDLIRFVGKNGNTGINNYICLNGSSSAECTYTTTKYYRIIGYNPTTNHIKIIKEQLYSTTSTTYYATSGNTILYTDSTPYKNVNNTWLPKSGLQNIIVSKSWKLGNVLDTKVNSSSNRANIAKAEYASGATTKTFKVGILSVTDYALAYGANYNFYTNPTSGTVAKNWIALNNQAKTAGYDSTDITYYGTTKWEWTMTREGTYESNGSVFWRTDPVDGLGYYNALQKYVYRPVFYVSGDTLRYVSGSGTRADPFIVDYLNT